MATLSTGRKLGSSGPVLACDDDVYGTFDGRPPLSTPHDRSSSDSTTTGYKGLLRAAGVTSVLLFAASCLTSSTTEPLVQTTVSTESVNVQVLEAEAENVQVLPSEVAAEPIKEVLAPNAIEKEFIDNVDPEHIREYLHKYSR